MTPKEAWNSLLKKLVVFEFLYNSDEKKELLKIINVLHSVISAYYEIKERIKINKEIIEENFDLNPSLCHDLEVENTALEFFLMLTEVEK